MFKEGELTSQIFSFDESHGVSSSTLVDFSTRITWCLSHPKEGRAVRSVSAAHLLVPHDHLGSFQHQYLQEGLAALATPVKRPKTFKPVLIYQRSEYAQRFSCNSDIKDTDKNDSNDVRKENGFGFPVMKSEEGPLKKRDFTENLASNMPDKVRDLCSLYGKEMRKLALMNSSAGTHPSNVTDLSSGSAAFDASHSNMERLSFALSDKRKSSFDVPVLNPGTGQNLCRSWMSALTRHNLHGNVTGSATEIRRALLLNHPVITSRLATEDTLQKIQPPSELPSHGYLIDHQHAAVRHSQEAASKIANRFILPFSPQQEIPTWSPSPLPLPDPRLLGRAGTAQSSDGQHGSFLQLLFSKDSPGLAEGASSALLARCAARPPALNTMKERLPSPAKDTVFQTAAAQMVQHHFGLTPSPGGGSTGDVDDRENRRHKCPFCDVTCTNNGQLKGHVRVHTGEKPFQCECGRAFARNEELTRHRRIHSGIRPHQCHTCGKRFGRKDHLNKHQKTHLRTCEKKVHLCHVGGCRQRYTRSDALARHQWGAHGIRAKTSRYRVIPFAGVQSSQQEAGKN